MASDMHFEQLEYSTLGRLDMQNQLLYRRINITDAGHDMVRIKTTGVSLVTVETSYVVVAGDQPRMTRLQQLGFTLVIPKEEDYVRRRFRVLITSIEDYARLHQFIDDVWPTERKFPRYVTGRSLDDNLQRARDAGFAIELCKTPTCD